MQKSNNHHVLVKRKDGSFVSLCHRKRPANNFPVGLSAQDLQDWPIDKQIPIRNHHVVPNCNSCNLYVGENVERMKQFLAKARSLNPKFNPNMRPEPVKATEKKADPYALYRAHGGDQPSTLGTLQELLKQQVAVTRDLAAVVAELRSYFK